MMSDISGVSGRMARWGMVALGISIPISTALDNFLLLVLLVIVLLARAREVIHLVTQNAVARASVLLFALLLLGMTYGEAALNQALTTLGKYADLACVPLLMVAARDAETRRHALQGFIASMLVTAVLSWLVGLHILPVAGWMWAGCTPDNPAIFRSSITHSILMAYTAYYLTLHAYPLTEKKARLAAAGALMAGANVLFMVQGRTGYAVLLALLAYGGWAALARYRRRAGRTAGWRDGAAVAALIMLLAAATYVVSPRMQARVDLFADEFRAWQPNVPVVTSTGERLAYYYNTLELIKQHPWWGVGTGGFPEAYAQQVQGTGWSLARNPHNEYLLMAAQLGVPGLALLLYLFYVQWIFAAAKSDTVTREAARGLVLTLMVASLFNSSLMDHTEGLFFAFMSALLFTKDSHA